MGSLFKIKAKDKVVFSKMSCFLLVCKKLTTDSLIIHKRNQNESPSWREFLGGSRRRHIRVFERK